ncbi:phage tail sheath subtilisin-like domain-containing protein [Nannocystis sp. ILAH1]|uniref:phage tail sheath family protein n=1 Tax=unclassified Nannocystis TaxID=2627009 RepID=UPI00226E3971|nr:MULTISPECIES: phage tail sheath subtilisin-like domain-containing protein [unclassified Nannocystis]MCY0990925.1 phage tail sheath subtilisin-like domain-containing protein [Nannocystis sp. ILAH1]MCY1064428.1 phage tail sheath subtilisin-like domain-containing protein [Nannocystis sp. RBIL2]
MVALTYPGVYIQEVPSGVRTITGVSTSTALFVGRTERGVMNKPTRVFNFTEFQRNFGAGTEESELATAVRLFFTNGGTVAIITRIADDTATPASVTLEDLAGNSVLKVTAREAGRRGSELRVAIDYATQNPSELFNLTVTRVNSTSLQESETEVHSNLSMRPGDPRFVDDIVGQNSALVTTERVPVVLGNGFSVGARVVDGTNLTDIDIPDGAVLTLVVDGGNPANAVFDADTGTFAGLPAGILVTVVQAGTGKALLRVTSAGSAVQVIPSGGANDIATYMQMGAARGGLEQSPYGAQRPAPTGLHTTISHENLGRLAALDQENFQIADAIAIEVDGTTLEVFNLNTTGTGRFYKGNITSLDSLLNVQEKLHALAAQFNTKAQGKANFPWRAQVHGYTLAFYRLTGGANLGAGVTVTSTGAGLFDNFGFADFGNARYYSLAPGGAGGFQTDGTEGFDGDRPTPTDYDEAYELIDREVDIFNILVLPRDAKASDADRNVLWGPASAFCQRRRAVLLVDPPSSWVTAADVTAGIAGLRVGLVKDHSILYWSRLLALNEFNLVKPVDPSGAMAGVIARTDAQRGVWKAPAGLEADIRGILGVERQTSDPENGDLNQQAANNIRVFTGGIVSWGARTMDGYDNSGSEYKYVPVRRLALYLAESLRRGLQFAVFEPNDEPLWAQIRLAAGAFMHGLFRQGAFQGQKKSDAYFVKVDAETTTQNDINLGIVNVIVGFAPLKPAEFVVVQLKQIAGQIQT